jgi:serine/threonine-protein kinase HipA
VVVEGQRLGLPKGSAASTHILKPAIAAVDDSVTNEAFCMALARRMKLRVADTQILMAADQRILLVRRYDRRRADDGAWSRLHQEDFCQALGVPPDLKYQNEGGPDLQACFSLLRRATRPSAPEVIRLLDAVTFNALIGNHDAHAKNFSILYQQQRGVLAPLYDLLCTAVYPTLTDKMAMKVGSKYRFNEVQVRHWEQLAKAAGLSGAQTKKRVAGIAKRLPSCARGLQTEALYSGQPLVERIISLIEQRCALTLERLNT